MPSIPFVLSVVAPLLAAGLRLMAPAEMGASVNLVWLLGLVPIFLAARHLGWPGALYGLIWAVVPVLLTSFAVAMRYGFSPDLTALGAVVVTLAAAALGAGLLCDSWNRELEAERGGSAGLRATERLENVLSGDLLEFFLDKAFAGARRAPPLTVVLFEISDLADYAEVEGKGVAAEALGIAADTLSSETRAMNVLGRLDEETFIVLLQGEDVSGAWSFANRVLQEIEARPAPWDGRIRMNAGIATAEEGLQTPDELVRRAQLALAAARPLGSDAVVVYGGAHERALGISGMFILQPDGELKEIHRTV
jgi:diguanylate cyclase (GGDEF)-like protein